MIIPRVVSVALAATIVFSGCVGTDTIADPVILLPPRLEVTPSMTALQIGQQVALEASFFDELGLMDDDVTISWSSSSPEIVAVHADGTLDAVAEGQTSIVASVAHDDADSILATATVLITVVADPTTQLALVRVTPTMADLAIGDTLVLVASALNASGGSLTAEGYTWTSSDPEILSIDEDGVAVALSAGSVSVRAATGGIQSPAVAISILGTELVGTFMSRGGYKAEGTAHLGPDNEGQLILTFLDDFIIDHGPRLEVFLSPVDRVAPESINVGILKDVAGSQTYDLPEDAELGDYGWVIVHCVPFNVSFGFAELK
ncbi:MAG: hypothetical protein HOM68_11805 [Gemmatimonadetes bacterium]|nr:hypothetical protein [Gemmatimonadota bacterium]MBT5057216.1 hypothetical protein [Gemmatimonadota bacterium]MBT5145602.1 hypothetical protein [Gemmatimonadota bacterium]MBT5588501.1 hypothetical protein [Gemmatimonadota bacterium]MBT5963602.1 hypothetical protein [Gemmatimonadota bacterium]